MDESDYVFSIFCQQFKMKQILEIKSDHCEELENEPFKYIYEESDILNDFSCPITPEHKGIVKRK